MQAIFFACGGERGICNVKIITKVKCIMTLELILIRCYSLVHAANQRIRYSIIDIGFYIQLNLICYKDKNIGGTNLHFQKTLVNFTTMLKKAKYFYAVQNKIGFK